MLALARNIAGLDRASELLEEVIIVNNASTEDYSELRNYIAGETSIPFRYLDAPENLGVARGRNFAVSMSGAPYLIMLDDDAEMGNRDCLVNLVEEFNTRSEGREKAIISFKVLYYDTRQIQVNAFPHKDFGNYSGKHQFQTYYFAGGAHAIRRDVFEKLGGYPTDFFYGMEEYDLSYRVLEMGYSIVYSDRIVMLHKESPGGRKTRKEKQAMMWLNKSKVAFRHLPLPYFYSTAIMWSVEYLKKTGFNVGGWIKGWRQVLKIPRTEQRKPVSRATMAYLRETKARLWY